MPLKSMKAVVLAGGKGKRLGVLTRYRPKPMLLIKGRPFLEYLLIWLKRYGLRDIIICSGYLSKQIEEYFGDGKKFDLKINYSIDKEPLGTAGALRQAGRYIKGDFVLLNGDSFIDIALNNMIDYHRRKKNIVTMAVVKVNNSHRYGNVQLDNSGQIISFNEKSGRGEYINAGLYICQRNLLKRLPGKGPASLERDGFPYLGKNRLGVYKTNGFFIDIGTVSDYGRLKSMGDKFLYIFKL